MEPSGTTEFIIIGNSDEPPSHFMFFKLRDDPVVNPEAHPTRDSPEKVKVIV